MIDIEKYTKEIELNPNDAENYFHRGQTYLFYLQFAQAADDFTRCIELATLVPHDFWFETGFSTLNNRDLTICWRGACYFELSCYEEALADYTAVVQSSGSTLKESTVLTTRAKVYKALDRHCEAVSDCQAAIAMTNRNQKAYEILAEVAEQRGETSFAERMKRKASACSELSFLEEHLAFHQYDREAQESVERCKRLLMEPENWL